MSLTETIEEIERPRPRASIDAEFIEAVADRIEAGDAEKALDLVEDFFPADLARLLPRLDFDQALAFYRWFSDELAGEVVPELEDDFRATLLESVPAAEVTAVVAELDTDDAADVLGDLPDEVVQDVLPKLEDAAEIVDLLGYEEDSAGGIMEADFVAVHERLTVEQATEVVRRLAEDVDPVYVVYTLDEDDRFSGIVRQSHLLLSPADRLISQIVDRDAVTVGPDTDQEEVARIMERYDLIALPVVDARGKLLGRITIDDIVDVIREEAEEDMQRMSGLAGDEEISDSVFKISAGRLVWLILGLVGALLSSLVIHSFEAVLERAVILASFIPVVMAMAGNAGIQSSAIAVQGLASGDLWSSDVTSQLRKELVVAVLNAVALAFVFALLIVGLQASGMLSIALEDAVRLGVTVGLSLAASVVLAGLIGATVPLVLHRFKIDPALATGPFITTSNDILGLIVYFLIASTLFLN